jgi:hypothetical protein
VNVMMRFMAAPREIPRLAGENASLRDDVGEKEAKEAEDRRATTDDERPMQ